MTRTQVIKNEISYNSIIQRKIFLILAGSIFILFFTYIYMIGSITFNVIARKSLENNVYELSNKISQMEINYINKVNKIDKEYALSNGYVDTKENLFAIRNINFVAIK